MHPAETLHCGPKKNVRTQRNLKNSRGFRFLIGFSMLLSNFFTGFRVFQRVSRVLFFAILCLLDGSDRLTLRRAPNGFKGFRTVCTMSQTNPIGWVKDTL